MSIFCFRNCKHNHQDAVFLRIEFNLQFYVMSGTDRRSTEDGAAKKQKEPSFLVCVTTFLELMVVAFVITVDILIR